MRRKVTLILTRESYCIIIGSDSIVKNLSGKDKIWYVDYNEPLLILFPGIERLFKTYDKKNDSKANRIKLIIQIREKLQNPAKIYFI